MSDTETELLTLIGKLRKMEAKLAKLGTEQDKLKEKLALTKARADEVRRKAEQRKDA